MPTARPPELKYLQTTALFQRLSEDTLVRIMDDSYERAFSKDEYLFFQDDPANEFSICIEGRIKLTQLTPEGNQVIMHYPGPGEVFGLIAVLRGIRFPVTAQAVEDSRVLAWKDTVMTDWMRREPQIAINSIRILSGFIENFQNRITELSTERVERRIARTLLRLAQQAGHKDANGIRIDLHLSRQDIAEMAGTTLYTVSRTLRKWETEGFLDGSGPLIRITNPHHLVSVADDLPS
jgi:CRP-like cAMP-binding protein